MYYSTINASNATTIIVNFSFPTLFQTTTGVWLYWNLCHVHLFTLFTTRLCLSQSFLSVSVLQSLVFLSVQSSSSSSFQSYPPSLVIHFSHFFHISFQFPFLMITFFCFLWTEENILFHFTLPPFLIIIIFEFLSYTSDSLFFFSSSFVSFWPLLLSFSCPYQCRLRGLFCNR